MESYIIIPAVIRTDKKLSPIQKLLMAELITLSNGDGYCWPSNDYLAGALGSSRRTIIDNLKALAKKGYVKISYGADSKRTITPLIKGGAEIAQGGVQNLHGGVQNLHPNIVYNTNTNTVSSIDTVSNTIQDTKNTTSNTVGNTNNTIRVQKLHPSKEDVLKFFDSVGGERWRGEEFFDNFEATGWIFKGEAVHNWQALAKAWLRKIKPEPKMKALK